MQEARRTEIFGPDIPTLTEGRIGSVISHWWSIPALGCRAELETSPNQEGASLSACFVLAYKAMRDANGELNIIALMLFNILLG